MKKRTNIMDSLMAESIHMPGFPQIVVTRHFCYQWLTDCGWSQSERGFGSLDYLVFAAASTELPLTDEAERDYWLGQVRSDFLRDTKKAAQPRQARPPKTL
jgi:hypothetical protein